MHPAPSSTLFPYTTLFRSDQSLRPHGWAGRLWSPAIGVEHKACREAARSEEHTSELQSPYDLVCRLLLEKKNLRQREIEIGAYLFARIHSDHFCNGVFRRV